jgi:NADH:ubiquinone oxidoreductase subunit
MGLLKNIFTWWEGATFGTALNTKLRGTRVGTDGLGNIYFEGKPDSTGFAKRWVMYSGSNDASRVPSEWHGWLHHTHDAQPESGMPAPRKWEIAATPNLTGTAEAYRPAGALEAGGRRASATGDYEAWSPENA